MNSTKVYSENITTVTNTNIRFRDEKFYNNLPTIILLCIFCGIIINCCFVCILKSKCFKMRGIPKVRTFSSFEFIENGGGAVTAIETPRAEAIEIFDAQVEVPAPQVLVLGTRA